MRALRYTLAGLALGGCLFALLLARASALDAENTAAASESAVHLVPFEAQYLVRYAAWHPEQRVAALRRAVAVNPFAAQAWIDLGFDAEFRRGDLREAEACYREAARRDRMFVPKWTLTNFFFRREQPAEFLRWARATLDITPYAATPIFAEMWLLLPNDPTRLAAAVPDNPNSLWQYAWYLSNAHQIGAIPPVVARLAALTSPREAENYGKSTIVGPILDRMLQGGFADKALQVWSSLSGAHWTALPVPSVEHPVSNGDFGSVIWPHGFDWLPITTPGVASEQQTAEHSFQLEFSGDQPDPCAVLQQWVPLAPQHTYRVRWTAHTDADTAADLAWHIRTGIGRELAASPALGNALGTWTFTFDGARGAYLLSLEYTRQAGYTRAKGTLTLRDVSAVALPQ